MAKKPPEPKPPPDPPIERVYTREFEFGRYVRHGQAVLCPRCGKPSLEYLGVKTFDREPDGFTTSFVQVYHSIITQHRLPQPRNDQATSAERHHGIIAEFGCNSCFSAYDAMGKDKLMYQGLGHGIWLEVIERDGVCVLHWVYDPLPKGYGDEPTAALPPPG